MDIPFQLPDGALYFLPILAAFSPIFVERPSILLYIRFKPPVVVLDFHIKNPSRPDNDHICFHVFLYLDVRKNMIRIRKRSFDFL